MFWPLLVACSPKDGSDTGKPPDPTITTPDVPALVALEISQPAAIAPLSRHLHVETDVATRLTVSWTDGEHEVEVSWDDPVPVHDHTLVGFHPGRTYDLSITLAAGAGALVERETVQTEAWPSGFPVSELTITGAGAASPGHTLVPVNTSNMAMTPHAAVVVFDELGAPCFLLEIDDQLEDAVPYADGLLVTSGLEQRIARYFHWDGTEEWAFTLDPAAPAPQIPVAASIATRFHHDVLPKPGEPGRFIALGRAAMGIEDWHTSYADPEARGDRIVADDVLLDFSEDGTVHSEISLAAILPLERIGFDSLEDVYPGWADWTHANSVVWDDGGYVVSLRHQDAVVRIDATTGELSWILGNPDNWVAPWSDALLTPEPGVRWQWHQHAARMGPDAPDGWRTLLLYDNANWQASPFTGAIPVDEPTTRVVQFGIDEANRRVRMDWSYEVSTVAGNPMFSEAVGDADYLANGNVLSTWGMLDALPGGPDNVDVGLGNRSIRVIEFDPATLQDVWHLYLTVPIAENDAGWTAYRAERIPSLYGPVD